MVTTARGSTGPLSVPAPELTSAGEACILELARAAAEDALGGRALVLDPGSLPPDLLQPAGVFVTITRDGHLRACMGRLDPDAPLWMNLLGAADSAARSDPRFSPILLGELPGLHLEVSVLGPLVPLEDPGAFQPGLHGIVVERGWQRGLLLPQVATERGWSAVETLEAACWKAGLSADSWHRRGTRLLVFGARVLGEP